MATQLKDIQSIEAILSEMTLEEKAEMIQGSSPFRSAAMPKYGIPPIYMIDTCTGLNLREYLGEAIYQQLSAEAEKNGTPLDREKNGYMGGLLLALAELKKRMAAQAASGAPKQKREDGCYPPAIALGCTWNPDIAELCGKTVAREIGSHGIDMILGPCINIHRDPLAGRLSESYSEDPKLLGEIAAGMVRGIQSTGLLADVKHFAANSQEKDRLGVNERVSERALREIYFPAFHACLKAGAKTVMSAYNKLNGIPCAMNEWLLTKVLREEWGFDGFVVSDWGASYDVPSAIAAGTDLTMPGPLGIRNIVDAVNSGRLPEEKLDTAIRNILRVTLGSTAFTGKYPEFHLQEAYEATEMAARESVVLLKNDGVLPLDKTADVVFCGKRSKDFVLIPASVAASTDLGTNPYDRACELSGTEHVRYEVAGKETKYWIVTVGADACEGADRLTMDMDEDDRLELERALKEAEAAGGKLILIVNATGPVDLSAYESRVSAIVCPFFAGMMSGKVTADILFGLVNPSGHLPLTWPRHYYDCPSYKNYGGENKEVWHGEGIYVGYRWYDARHIRPLYSFGHGLSYTSFALSDLCVPESVRIDDEPLAVQVNVKNTGAMAGSEVVQLYVHDGACCYDRPEKELKAFCKVYLQPGEEKTVTLTLKKEDFAGWYADFGEWIVQPGRFELLLGISAEDIRLTASVRVRCRDPFGLSGRTAIGALVKDRQALEIVNRIMEDDMETLAAVALAYAPDKTLQELWNATNIHGALLRKGWDEEEIARRYAAIMEEFEELQARKI